MLKIRRHRDRLICNMGIPYLERWSLYWNGTHYMADIMPRVDMVIRGSKISSAIYTLRPRQNGHPFADNTFKRIFLDKNVKVSIRISLKFVLNGPIANIPAFVQIMAWRRSGDKPLSEPMMVKSPTHTCVTRPQIESFQHTIDHTQRIKII